MHGMVVAILRGGPSREHDVSLRTGHAIINALPRERYTVRDVFIDRNGVWHERGLQTDPARVLMGTDVAIIALHGEYGEDGEVQKLLDRFGVPYTGSDSLGSFISMHKVLAKEKARAAGIRVPEYRYIERVEDIEDVANKVTRNFIQPVVVKPVRWGSSVGVTLAGGFHDIHQAVTGLFNEGADGVMIEQYVRGTEATAGVLEQFRGQPLYTLPIVELSLPKGTTFFSKDAKYSGETLERCPAMFERHVSDELQRAAATMHTELGLRHYSRSDFIVSPKGIYYLETNSLPGLTTESLFPKALAAVGITYTQFLDHLVGLALESSRRYSHKVPVKGHMGR